MYVQKETTVYFSRLKTFGSLSCDKLCKVIKSTFAGTFSFEIDPLLEATKSFKTLSHDKASEVMISIV